MGVTSHSVHSGSGGGLCGCCIHMSKRVGKMSDPILEGGFFRWRFGFARESLPRARGVGGRADCTGTEVDTGVHCTGCYVLA